MTKRIIWSLLFILGAVLLQSILLSRLTLRFFAMPDITLCILVYFAYVNGTMPGQITGFLSGFIIDIFSVADLGLNSFIRTIIGGAVGFIKGTFYLDYIFLPMALCAGATFIKAIFHFLLSLIFPEIVPVYSLFGLTLWIELGMNTVLAPLVFAFLRLFSPILTNMKEKN